MARPLSRTKPQMAEEESTGLDEFAGKRQRVTKAGDSPVVSGWSVDRRPKVTDKDRPPRFTVPDDGEEVLFAFVEVQPFASFFQHWVLLGKEGRKPYTCLGNNCPMCAVGDKPKSSDWFNVIEMDADGTGTLKIWYCSADPAAAIKDRADNKRTSPINKPGLYFAASKRKGKNNFNTYSVDPVREDELEADWGVTPLTPEQIKAFEADAFGPDLVRINTKSELQAITDEYLSD